MLDAIEVVKLGLNLGVDFIDVRLQDYYSEYILLDNGVIREINTSHIRGVGIRVVVNGVTGYSSTYSLDKSEVERAVLRAYKVAKASFKAPHKVSFQERPTSRGRVSSSYSLEPEDIDFSEKISVLKAMDSVARGVSGIISVTLRLGYERDNRVYASSSGDYVECSRRMVGVSTRLVALVEGTYETLYDQKSSVAGWEFIKSSNWDEWVLERAKLVVESAKAPSVNPGQYDVVLDNEMVGLMLHEAFGHAAEGDTVLAGNSILGGKLGEKIASDLVTIVDNGLVEGGVFVPYDDEGTPKKKTYLVKEGVLAGYLHSLTTAKFLRGEPTGNARVMSYQHPLLVRQTNTYMEPGDWEVEEMVRDMKMGLYISGCGSMGGQVNPLMGSFTFTSGPSYIVEGGEPKKLVKGVMLSGLILETLKKVDAVGRDLVVRTSVFGGCGKDNQVVRVGGGGPHVRVRGFTIGG